MKTIVLIPFKLNLNYSIKYLSSFNGLELYRLSLQNLEPGKAIPVNILQDRLKLRAKIKKDEPDLKQKFNYFVKSCD